MSVLDFWEEVTFTIASSIWLICLLDSVNIIIASFVLIPFFLHCRKEKSSRVTLCVCTNSPAHPCNMWDLGSLFVCSVRMIIRFIILILVLQILLLWDPSLFLARMVAVAKKKIFWFSSEFCAHIMKAVVVGLIFHTNIKPVHLSKYNALLTRWWRGRHLRWIAFHTDVWCWIRSPQDFYWWEDSQTPCYVNSGSFRVHQIHNRTSLLESFKNKETIFQSTMQNSSNTTSPLIY